MYEVHIKQRKVYRLDISFHELSINSVNLTINNSISNSINNNNSMYILGGFLSPYTKGGLYKGGFYNLGIPFGLPPLLPFA